MDIRFYLRRYEKPFPKIISVILLCGLLTAARGQDVTSLSALTNTRLSAGVFSNNYLSVSGTLLKRIKAEYNLSLFNESPAEQNNLLDLKVMILKKKSFLVNVNYTGICRFDPWLFSNFTGAGALFSSSGVLGGAEAMYDFSDNTVRWSISAGYRVIPEVIISSSFGHHKQTLFNETEFGAGAAYTGKIAGASAGIFVPTSDLSKFYLSLSLYFTIFGFPAE